MSNPRLERFAEAYLAMAGQARYWPQAPGDGFRRPDGIWLHPRCEGPWFDSEGRLH